MQSRNVSEPRLISTVPCLYRKEKKFKQVSVSQLFSVGKASKSLSERVLKETFTVEMSSR